MHKITKEIQQDLMQMASQLPAVQETVCERHYYKGSEILEWGTITEFEGKPIDPEKTYAYNYPVIVLRNHYRRLKSAWKANSIQGVIRYCEELQKLVNEHENNKQVA